MNQHTPTIQRMISRSLTGEARAEAVATVTDEHLALLATGEAHLLDEAQRRSLMDAVATDPALARLVGDLARTLDAAGGEAALALPDPPAGEGPPVVQRTGANSGGRAVLHRLVWTGWAAAACLTLALGLWTLPAGSAAPGNPAATDGKVVTFDASDQTEQPDAPDAADDYWAMYEAENQGRIQWPTYALVSSGVACLLLSIPVAYWAMRGIRGGGGNDR